MQALSMRISADADVSSDIITLVNRFLSELENPATIEDYNNLNDELLNLPLEIIYQNSPWLITSIIFANSVIENQDIEESIKIKAKTFLESGNINILKIRLSEFVE